MADDKYSSNLDSGDLARYPSAATPLSIDELLALRGGGAGEATPAIWAGGYPGAETADQGTPPPPAAQPSPAFPPPNTAAPTAAPIPATASPTTAQDYSMAGLAGLQRDMQDARAAENEIPTSNPKLDELNRELAAKSEPTPLRTMTPADTKAGRTEGTGAMLAEYKPSVMSRIGRGVRSGAIGFLTGGIPGAVVGAIEPQDIRGGTAYGAPNASYGREESERQREVGDLSGQAAAAKEAWKAQVDAAKAKATQIDASGKLAGDLTTGATGVENAATAGQRATTEQQTADQNSPEGKAKAFQDLVVQRRVLGQQLGLKGDELTRYSLSGTDPRLPAGERPSAELQRYYDLKAAMIRQNGGRPLSVEQLASISSDLRTNAGTEANPFTDPAVTSVVEKATADVNKYKTDHRFVPTHPGRDLDAYNNGIREIFAAANEKLKKTGVQFDMSSGPTFGNLQRVGQTPAAATAPPAGATHTVIASDGKRHWANPTTHQIFGLAE